MTQVRLKSGNWQKRCVWAPCSTHIANYCSMQFDDSYCFVRSHDNCLKMRWFFPHLRHFLMTGWNVTNIAFRWWWFPANKFGIWPILSDEDVNPKNMPFFKEIRNYVLLLVIPFSIFQSFVNAFRFQYHNLNDILMY